MNKQQLFENIQKKKSFLCVGPVSYTHLTLPTKA